MRRTSWVGSERPARILGNATLRTLRSSCGMITGIWSTYDDFEWMRWWKSEKMKRHCKMDSSRILGSYLCRSSDSSRDWGGIFIFFLAFFAYEFSRNMLLFLALYLFLLGCLCLFFSRRDSRRTTYRISIFQRRWSWTMTRASTRTNIYSSIWTVSKDTVRTLFRNVYSYKFFWCFSSPSSRGNAVFFSPRRSSARVTRAQSLSSSLLELTTMKDEKMTYSSLWRIRVECWGIYCGRDSWVCTFSWYTYFWLSVFSWYESGVL